MNRIENFHSITRNELQKFHLHIQSLVRHIPPNVFQLIFLFFTCTVQSYGQIDTNSYGKINVEITKQKKPKMIVAKVEIISAFHGGDSAWIKSIEADIDRSIQYRDGARKGKYIVTAAFIITKDGSISDVQCLKDPGFGMGAEVVRALKKRPRWLPAPANGRKVNEYRH